MAKQYRSTHCGQQTRILTLLALVFAFATAVHADAPSAPSTLQYAVYSGKSAEIF